MVDSGEPPEEMTDGMFFGTDKKDKNEEQKKYLKKEISDTEDGRIGLIIINSFIHDTYEYTCSVWCCLEYVLYMCCYISNINICFA
ncbi:MAG: hypothetical protein KAS32_18000 [Candidatus Peribacteraceae bacterium]|nr:hypothetical protein [Candidatus Peribacteraceae bacterium]